MCDCYETKCNGCKSMAIQVHIADFCTPRENVKVYCPFCALFKVENINLNYNKCISIREKITNTSQVKYIVSEKVIKKPLYKSKLRGKYLLDDGSNRLETKYKEDKDLIGKEVLFIVKDKDAYGIHLN